jgi:peptidyl-prolyl cis-trans isomerase A (cyclophilin A)
MHMKRNLFLVSCLTFAAACSQRPVETPRPAPEQPAAAAAPQAAQVPAVFKAKFATTKGDFVIEVHRDWAPNGADRFYELVKSGFFQDIAFFRAIEGFMVQFGIHGDPAVSAKWRNANIPDDRPSGRSNSRGALTFATAGPGTRTTQLFINFGDNGASLDGQGFTPIGQVVEGMSVVDSVYKGYGEGAPSGMGPDQGRVQAQGNAYLKRDFPKLDYIKSAQLVP